MKIKVIIYIFGYNHLVTMQFNINNNNLNNKTKLAKNTIVFQYTAGAKSSS